MGDSVTMGCAEIGHPIDGKAVGQHHVDNGRGTEAFEEGGVACTFPLKEATRPWHGIGRVVLCVECRVVLCVECVVLQVWYKMLCVPTYGALWLVKKKI